MANRDKVRVLYIAAWSRSGSTILSNVLGQLDGFYAVGELSYMWDRGFEENRLCGCGVPFHSCSEWNNILGIAYGSKSNINSQKMIKLRESLIRARFAPSMVLPKGDQLLKRRGNDYLQSLEKLYLAIQEHTRCEVIVDSSKYPMYGYLLGLIPTIDLHVIHLVRDPRATAYSWQRMKVATDKTTLKYLPQKGSAENSVRWGAWNLACEALGKAHPGKYHIVRYEDFIKEPQKVVRSLCNLVDETEAIVSAPFVDSHSIELEATHSVAGNPNRMTTGPINLELDNKWQTNLSSADRFLTTLLTWPLMIRYGYIIGH